jgi:hypothetical protein
MRRTLTSVCRCVTYSDPYGLCPEGVGADSAKSGGDKTTDIYCQDGTLETRKGGSWAWRNNNPGNLGASELAAGKNGGFAVFANRTVGNEAMWRQFGKDAARGLTLSEMITKYAPPFQNNTAAYIAVVSGASGVSPTTNISTLTETTEAAIIRAMQRHEGWSQGTVTVTKLP